jgi:hypothetical protein
MPPLLDLIRPGKFWAAAENEETTTFHLVIPSAKYTREALTANPTIHPSHDLMPPFSVSHRDLDDQGRAILDLKASGRANKIVETLDRRFQNGQSAITRARAVVIATARKGNRVPSKQLADTFDFTLPATPRMRVSEVRTYVTVSQFKNGQREFLVDVTAQTLNEVEVSVSNGASIRVDGAGAGRTVKVPIPGGRKFRVRIPVPLTVRNESRTTRAGRRWTRYDCWYYPAHNKTSTREIWTGGDITLKIQGKGGIAINKSVRLRAESWASGWLNRTPPPRLRHNHC